MWYIVVFQPSKFKKTHFQPQIWSIWPIFPNDSESLPKVCYIKRKNSEILSKRRNSESAGGSDQYRRQHQVERSCCIFIPSSLLSFSREQLNMSFNDGFNDPIICVRGCQHSVHGPLGKWPYSTRAFLHLHFYHFTIWANKSFALVPQFWA